MGRDALDHIAQIDERIDLQVLAGLHQRTEDGRAVGRRVAPREQPRRRFCGRGPRGFGFGLASSNPTRSNSTGF